ncbi:Hypothetical protein SRAE_1000306200 [Strongyloides ratti]|uniref:Uncharacterized protein n=1 Tax=Strongyloides ratti TaxID=34506 RepID=A0A090MX48_STRRB|nr:Hypothetical protein SRAE_1000306200 [Strongyloides ratti]CEF64809.1 Hypothetical protein SRAE_1000306200 [Strongyloides ratti]
MKLFYNIIDGSFRNLFIITLFLWEKVNGRYMLTNDLGQDIEFNNDQTLNYGEPFHKDEPLVSKNKIDDSRQVMIINSEITKDDHPIYKFKGEEFDLPENEGMISQNDKTISLKSLS